MEIVGYRCSCCPKTRCLVNIKEIRHKDKMKWFMCKGKMDIKVLVDFKYVKPIYKKDGNE